MSENTIDISIILLFTLILSHDDVFSKDKYILSSKQTFPGEVTKEISAM